MSRVTVLGAGSWGTALAMLLGKNGHDVLLWSVLEDEVKMLKEKREQVERLPGIPLPDKVEVTGSLKEALEAPELVVFAVASPYVRSTAKLTAPYIKEGQIVVNVAKGIEESTLSTLSQVLESELPGADVAVLSGPSHAEEVSRGIPTTCVVGARSRKTAMYIQDIFMNEEFFRVYTSPDIEGIELGGSLKNVIALAAGITDGLGFGDNTKAALMTRGIAEMARLGMAMGGQMETFSGLSGVGDLIVTCTSLHSRNRKAGYLIGKGCTMEEAMKEVKQVVEGVYSARAALLLAEKYQVEMPIVEKINQVLFENKSPLEAVAELVQRDKRKEYSSLKWDR
ncbi:NAD(P)H-dependent glycerol-3-phosphate dehydrogenase [Anaerolentibacter hominis]|uniref:NAD(P)H-dependent glycerol-3-phosphate dehydrogenase n=1 Tax=Anaerolentibacter hominis TaxID=3079009 RepID=UPI0031B85155